MISEDTETIEDTAAKWFVVLRDDDVTAAELAGHVAWLAADPRHQAAWDGMDALWSKLDGLAPEMASRIAPEIAPIMARENVAEPDSAVAPATDNVVPLPLRETRQRPSVQGWRRFAAAAAVVLMIGGASWVAAPAGTVPGLFASERTGVGERRNISLPDGSTVALNSGSALSVRFSAGERRVVLHHGEGFFDVAANADRPFVVEAAGGHVKVVGTAFDVKRTERDVAVAVARGIVEVAGEAGAPVRLHRGQAVRYAGQVGRLAGVEAMDVGAWRQGRLVFQAAPLRDVLEDLQRYRHGRIILMDGSLASRPVTGMFRADRTDSALDTIGRTLGLRLVRITPLLVLVYSGD